MTAPRFSDSALEAIANEFTEVLRVKHDAEAKLVELFDKFTEESVGYGHSGTPYYSGGIHNRGGFAADEADVSHKPRVNRADGMFRPVALQRGNGMYTSLGAAAMLVALLVIMFYCARMLCLSSRPFWVLIILLVVIVTLYVVVVLLDVAGIHVSGLSSGPSRKAHQRAS